MAFSAQDASGVVSVELLNEPKSGAPDLELVVRNVSKLNDSQAPAFPVVVGPDREDRKSPICDLVNLQPMTGNATPRLPVCVTVSAHSLDTALHTLSRAVLGRADPPFYPHTSTHQVVDKSSE